jgi:predicted 5'-methylthioadenosine/S-adenosylhomocysteine nucleosidase
MTRYLVVAATRAEAAHVPATLPTLITGVGKVAAAVRTTRALAAGDRDGLVVVNVGTAGALHPGLSGLHVPSRVVNHDISAAELSALGLPVDDELDLPGGDGAVLATGDTFVTDPAVRDRLARRAQLVDMEGFAVAYACLQLGVPVRLVKHVSDSADESALDWPSVVDRSARALADWLAQHL